MRYVGITGTSKYWQVTAKSAKEAKNKVMALLNITSDAYLIVYRKQPQGMPQSNLC